jgi:hypothetical protein
MTNSNGVIMKRLSGAIALLAILSLSSCTSSVNSSPKVSNSSPAVAYASKPVEISDYALVYAGEMDYTSFSAVVHNPNKLETLAPVELKYVAVGKNDVVMGNGTFSVPRLAPNESWVLSSTFNGDEVVKMDFEVPKKGALAKEPRVPNFTEDSFSGTKTEFYPSDNYGVERGLAVTKTIVSVPKNALTGSVILCAAYYASSKEFLGADCVPQDIIAGRKNGFKIDTFLPAQRPSQVILYARYGQ